MRKLRKQPVAKFNEYDTVREHGDRVYEPRPQLEGAYMYDLRESNGWGKRCSGELNAHPVKKNGVERLAVLAEDGFWYWSDL